MDNYFALKENIILVHGASRGLIHDLNNKRLFSIDSSSKKLLSLLLKGHTISNVLEGIETQYRSKFKKYLDLLVKNDLAYYSTEKIISGTFSTSKCIQKKISTVWLELRKACNLNCVHCYMDCNINSDKELNLITIDEWKSFIKDLSSFNPQRIILIGGEPLLFPHIEDLISYCRETCPYSQIVLYSNLTLLNPGIINSLKDNNVKVITSVYSNSNEIHDKITKMPGSFKKTCDSIKTLISNKIYVQANTVIMNYNKPYIKEIKAFTYDLTKVKGKIDIIRNVGKSKEYLIPHDLSLSLNRIKCKADFNGIDYDTFHKNFSGNNCWQGKLNITCDGYISPCIMGSKFINRDFNIRKHNIAYIMENCLIPSFWNLSKDKIEKCCDCEYRYVCKDCRPINVYNNNILNKDINCTYDPYTGIWN